MRSIQVRSSFSSVQPIAHNDQSAGQTAQADRDYKNCEIIHEKLSCVSTNRELCSSFVTRFEFYRAPHQEGVKTMLVRIKKVSRQHRPQFSLGFWVAGF
jgi:hypothetical protein